jgi:predicted kinase
MMGLTVERLDHLGLVAGMCQEIGLAEYLDGMRVPVNTSGERDATGDDAVGQIGPRIHIAHHVGPVPRAQRGEEVPALLPPQRRLIVVTGIQAAGKSTVARLLAQRFTRGVHVEADTLQHMIVSGSEGVQEPGTPTGEAARQYHLRLKHMCLLGRSFAEAGFTAVLDDIILGDGWRSVQAHLRGVPYVLIVLAPRVEIVARERDRRRAKRPLGEAWAVYLDHAFRTTMEGVGHWIDTSEQTPTQTVEQILLWLHSHEGTSQTSQSQS